MNNNLNSVSIITVTHKERHELLNVLVQVIKNQNYNNIIEWVIVSDNNIDIKFDLNIPTNIIINDNKSLGTLMNIANDNTKGDIIIIMNDDDYYFNNYICECVNKLKKSSNLLVGGDTVYIYDFILNRLYKNSLNKYIFGYKKEYLFNHKFIELNENIYEYFTDNFSVIKENILSENSIIKIIHNNNKLFKRDLLIASTITNIDKINNLDTELLNFILPTNIYNLYNNYINKEYINTDNYINYDIVYLAGGFSIYWDPEDYKLGGSEQAIVQLSNQWANQNIKVAVYGNFHNDKIINNVHYIQWTKFPFNRKIKNLILWRRHGILLLLYNNVYSDNLIIDLHDNLFTINDLDSILLEKLFNKVSYFNFKSNYHKDCFIDFLNNKNIKSSYDTKYNIIPNGIRIDNFKNNKILNNNEIIKRKPYRFCYCSSYDRGLEDIILKLWNKIFKIQPLAELHVYYGMDYIFDDNFKNKMKLLLSADGVMDHGRQPMDIIIREKYLSTFHLYINNSSGEIDCISIKESLITGCIPIISNYGVFKERDGIHFDWNPDNEELCNNIINQLFDYMNNQDKINNKINELKNSSTIIEWNTVSNIWLKYLFI